MSYNRRAIVSVSYNLYIQYIQSTKRRRKKNETNVTVLLSNKKNMSNEKFAGPSRILDRRETLRS